MSKTNYNFVVEYVHSDTFKSGTDEYNKEHRHGSLRYRYNILYSYSLPIAVKIWHKGKRYIITSIGRGCSCTTSRHLYLLNNNIWRSYNEDGIIPVYNVNDVLSDNKLDLSSYKRDLTNWLARGFTPIQLCDSGLRQNLLDRRASARRLAELDPSYEQIAVQYDNLYASVDSPDKRAKVRAEHRRIERDNEKNCLDRISVELLESDDVLFDCLLYDVKRMGSSIDTRISNLFVGLRTKLADTLLQLGRSYHLISDAVSNKLGYKVWFSLPSAGTLRDTVMFIKYCVDGNYGVQLVMRLSSLFDAYQADQDTLFTLDKWKSVSDSGSFYRINEGYAEVSQPNEHSFMFHLMEGDPARVIRDIRVHACFMQLLHLFVTTCRDKLGHIAYSQRELDNHGGRVQSSAGQSESNGSTE